MWILSDTNPDKIALQFGDDQLSFAALLKEIHNASTQIKKLPKAILVLEASPNFDFIIQFLAALNIGQPIALFSSQWSEQEKNTRLAILGNAMKVNAQGELLELYENNTLQHHPKLALILFTSGSTGQVKAVQLSRHNIESNCLAVIKALEFEQVYDQLLFLPLSYSFGLLGQLLPGLIAGITTQLISQFTEIKYVFETGKIPQMWSGVPSHWVAISRMASSFSEGAAKIKKVISAGAPLTLDLRKELIHLFPNAIIYNNYGLTEAAPRVLTYCSNDALFMEHYAGYPIGDWQIKLSEEDELLIKGNQIMLGYLNEKHQSRIQNGWLSTGDLAQITPSGLVAIRGRRDNQVNIGGEKINLNEIEQKICQIQGMSEVVVLPLDDVIYGTRLVTCLEKNNFAPTISEQQLAEQIRHYLLPRKLPITVQFINKIPRNQHGKPDRKTLLAHCSSKEFKE